MRFAVSAAALLAFVSSALAQNPNFNPVRKPGKAEELTAGTTYEIVWDVPAAFKDVTITIGLIGGAEQLKQIPLLQIAKGVKNSDGKYSWAIDKDLGKDNFYGLTLTSEANATDFQYSDFFHIKAVEGGSDSTTTVTSTITTATNTRTVSLSSVSTSTSLVTVTTTTARSSSTTSAPVRSTITSFVDGNGSPVPGPTGAGSNATTTTSTIATVSRPGAAAHATAGSALALLGGLAIAALAL